MKTLLALTGTWSVRRKIWTAVAAAVALVVIAVSVSLAIERPGGVAAASVSKPSTCADAYRVLALKPSQVAAAKPVCLVQSLKFSGELSGTVGEAFPTGTDNSGPAAMCVEPPRWTAFPQTILAMVLGGKAYRLRISAPGKSEHQPVTLANLSGVVELQSVKDPSADWNQVTGKLTLNADAVGGTIDASLVRDVAGARPVKVTGSWACGTVPAIPAGDAAVPCSNFYVLNHLDAADVARMKASGCVAEDLTFSGDVAAHVDHAVTDLAFPSLGGVYGDNYCGVSYGQYTATLKFSIGDETFQLNLNATSYPSVVPGSYPVANDLGPYVALNLGPADPTNHGVFVPNGSVEWDAYGGTFTIAPGLKSGTIDADLHGPAGLGQTPFSNVHVVGSWRCAS